MYIHCSGHSLILFRGCTPLLLEVWNELLLSYKQLCRSVYTYVNIQYIDFFPHPPPQHTNCRELRILVSLNLAICFMKMGEGKETELAALMTSVTSEATGIT